MPVLKDRCLVADLEDLGKAMAYIQDTHAMAFQFPDNPHQVLCFLFRQRRCWLIKNQDAAIKGYGPCNLDNLLFRDIDIAHKVIRIEIDIE